MSSMISPPTCTGASAQTSPPGAANTLRCTVNEKRPAANAAGRSVFSLVLEELHRRVGGVHDADNVVFEDKEHVRVLGIDALGLAEHGQDVLPRLVYVGLELLAGEGAGHAGDVVAAVEQFGERGLAALEQHVVVAVFGDLLRLAV